MRNLGVCIPSNGSPYLDKLWRTVVAEPSVQFVEIMDNKSHENTFTGPGLPVWVSTTGRFGMTIYEMWNDFRRRMEPYTGYMAFLNDDIEILPGTLELLVTALESFDDLAISYPDQRNTKLDRVPELSTISLTDTTGGAGGMTGYCFVMRSMSGIPLIDEGLTLYWGDDDLVKQTVKKGYHIGRVDGLPIQHAGSYTINRMDRGLRNSMMESDRAYFNQKYGENREPVV